MIAAWPDAQIDTAKVARKLALTGAANKGTAGPQHAAAAAAAAAAGLDSPLNTTTAAAVGKRKAGAAAVGGFQLPGLDTESEWQHTGCGGAAGTGLVTGA